MIDINLETLTTLMWGISDKLKTSKFHVCMTVPHEVFDEFPVHYHAQKTNPVGAIIYRKMVNDEEKRQIVLQCVNMAPHAHKIKWGD